MHSVMKYNCYFQRNDSLHLEIALYSSHSCMHTFIAYHICAFMNNSWNVICTQVQILSLKKNTRGCKGRGL